jgi:MFS family permease
VVGGEAETLAPVAHAPGVWMLWGLMAGMVLVPLNSSMIAVAIPPIGQGLAVPLGQMVWVISVYLVVMATLQPVAGRLGDMYGCHRLWFTGLSLFLAASVLAAETRNLDLLILFRGLQGAGGAIAMPNAVAIIRHAYHDYRLPRVLGTVSLVQGIGAALGPLVGSLVIREWGWPAIFWVSVPLSLFSGLVTWVHVPRTAPARPARLDMAGAVLLAGFLILATMFIEHTQDVSAVGWLAVPAGLAFVLWEFRAQEPVVRPDFFRRPPFRAANLAVLLNNLAMYTTLLWTPIAMARGAAGLLAAGPLLFAFSLASSGAAWLGARVAGWIGRRATVGGAFALQVVVVGTYLLVRPPAGLGQAVFLVLEGVGIGLGGVSFQATALQAVAASDAGAASGIYSTFRYFGSILASALIAFLAGSVIRYGMVLGLAAMAGLLLAPWFPKGASSDHPGLGPRPLLAVTKSGG